MKQLFALLTITCITLAAAASSPSQTTIWSVPDTGLPGFGAYVAHAGEIDADAFADFIVALRSDANGAVLSVRIGSFGSERFQVSVPPIEDLDVVGDVNADSIDDFGVLSRNAANGVTTLSLYSGANGALISLPLAPAGSSVGVGIKGILEGLGDLNSDGHDDFAVALAGGRVALPGQACLFNIPGVTLIYSGLDGSVLRSHIGTGGEAPSVVSRLSDISGDGISEYAIGGLGRPLVQQAPPCPSLPPISSYLQVFSGVDGSQLQSHTGLPLSGLGIEHTEDINLDGFPDILSQSRDASGAAPNQVLNHIISGIDGSAVACFDEIVSGQPVYGIYPAGYIDGDFAPEYYVVGTNSIRLVSGATTDTIWSMPISVSTTSKRPVAFLGDLNRDSGYELMVTHQNPARVTIISPITLPPAALQGVGLGFGRVNEIPPELAVSPLPAVGEVATFAITNGTPLASGTLLYSPVQPPYLLSTGHTIALDLPGSLPLRGFTLDANGAYSSTLLLLANSTIIGLAIHTQAYALSPSAPGAFEVTNGVYMRFGPPNF